MLYSISPYLLILGMISSAGFGGKFSVQNKSDTTVSIKIENKKLSSGFKEFVVPPGKKAKIDKIDVKETTQLSIFSMPPKKGLICKTVLSEKQYKKKGLHMTWNGKILVAKHSAKTVTCTK